MEMQQEVAVNRDWCLLSLIRQAEGRQLDASGDHYVIEQINASHIGDVAAGNVTRCQIGGCAVRCLTTNEDGILRLHGIDGETLCE